MKWLIRFDSIHPGSRRWLMAAGIFCLTVTGCATSIHGISQVAYHSPEFSLADLRHDGMALLPTIIMEEPPGKAKGDKGAASLPAPYTPRQPASDNGKDNVVKSGDGYRIILDEILLSRLRARWPSLKLVPTGDTLKRLNDAGMKGVFARISRDATTVGLDADLIKHLGEALHVRYIFLGRGIVSQSSSDASVSFVWTFGRKSILRSVTLSGQIWDTVEEKQVWEGSGVGYNQLTAYEKTPLVAQMATTAVDKLLDGLLPPR
jgi:hypothetical protein